MENISAQPRSGDGPAVEWVLPSTRDEADQAILTLSNDIGLILAQLAEDQAAWCQRTGRSPADYGTWRRRALFAKVHKEGQLRECKRVRAQLAGAQDGAFTLHVPEEMAELIGLCRQAVEAWTDDGAHGSASPLVDGALSALGECLDRLSVAPPSDHVGKLDLRGNHERPRLVSAPATGS